MTPAPPILIESATAFTPAHPTLDSLWHAWLTGAPPAPQPPTSWEILTHAALSQLLPKTQTPLPAALLLATTKGPMAKLEHWLRDPNPSAPPPTLGQAAATLAAQFQITGPAYTISTACSSGLAALIEAAELLQQNIVDTAIVVAADELSSFVHDGFTALKALSPTHCRPFDQNRDGLTLGSAAAALRLRRATQHDTGILLTGWSLTSDALHMTAPDRQAHALIQAIDQSLTMAHLHPADIDVILAHATATRYNDAMEAAAFEKIFPQKSPRPLITAVKGLIGHTLGASGALETALATKILHHQSVPAITGLQTPDFPPLPLLRKPQTNIPLRHLLKTASGFGGGNAAIILSFPNALNHKHTR